MGNYGIKVSKPGVDVLSAGPEDLIFSSQLNSFKIALASEATINVPNPSGGVTLQIDHDLGYIPGFLVYVDFGSTGVWYLPYGIDLFGGAGDWCTVRVSASSLFVFVSGPDGQTTNIRYFLFVDPGA